MKRRKNILLACGFGLLAYTSHAQTNTDTLQKLDEVDIIKAYEPILLSSDKVPTSPNLPNLVKAKPDAQTYTYSDVKGKITYNPEDIKPIKAAGKKPEKNQFFYAKIGFGYPLTPLLKLIITNPIQTKYRAGLDVDFIMTLNNKPKYQNYTDLKVRGFGEFFIKKKVAIGADIFYRLNQHKFYGYSDVIANKDSLKTSYNRFGGTFKLRGIEDVDYYYNGEVNFASVINKNVFQKPKELTINVDAEAGYNFKKNYWAGAKLNITNVSFNSDYTDTTFFAYLHKQNHFTFQAIPYFKVKYKIWQISVGPNLMITNRNFYVRPEIINQLQVYKDYFVIYNEWKSQVKINSLNNLSLENPFVNTQNYDNSVDETRTILGLRGSIKGFGYDVRFSQMVSRNNAQFLHNTSTILGVESSDISFDVQNIYNVYSWNPHIGLSYNKGNEFGAKAWFDYFIYSKQSAVDLSYLPSIKAGVSAFYNWKNKLYVNMDITGQSKTTATFIHDDSGIIGTTVGTIPIKGLIDVNLSANYYITKNIGVFVDLNNLGFQKWQQFYKYSTYSFQVIGGVKLSF